MVASGVEILVGALGLGGLLLRVMGPISITCLILLLGISAQGFISTLAEIHWGVSCMNIVVIIILSQYVNRYNVPLPTWSRRGGFKFVPFPLFELFPVLLSVLIGWIISYIFTVCGVFPEDRSQYRDPSLKISFVVTLTVAIFGSMLESIGDYVQTTVQSRVPVPPPHAINRGLMVEGLGSLLAGVMGAGYVTTSFSNMIGIIGITKVPSRRAFIISGIFLILMGICGKLGAVFVAIPKPVLAGPVFISLALLVGAALSNLKQIDLWSTRSQGVLGIAIMAGTVIPTWLKEHPGTFNTGSREADSTLMAFLGTPLVVGVLVAIFLDTTVPGTSREKRSATLTIDLEEDSVPRETTLGQAVSRDLSIYELPLVGRWLSACPMSRYIPFLPNPSGSPDRQKPIHSVYLA
ncbi:solute carrier family 23 member 2-like [Liolophura sinensis]|uniref:solute carrier family 23 member 2-like n=1 Tax=Liolophura sinensis TaxID=3198878 RepID=UPI003158320D